MRPHNEMIRTGPVKSSILESVVDVGEDVSVDKREKL